MAAAIFGSLMALFVTPASPAAAAPPTCTKLWEFRSPPTGTIINLVPTPASMTSGFGIMPCDLRQGSSGDGVRGLQQAFVTCYGLRLTVDGQFGPATASALRTVQGRIHVAVDGIVGIQTLIHLSYLQGSRPGPTSPCLAYNATGQSFRSTVPQS